MPDDVVTPITSADADTMADFGATAPAADTPPSQGEAAPPPPSREELQAKDVEAFTKAVEEVSPKADSAKQATDSAPAKVDTQAAAQPAKADAQPAVDADPVAAQKAAIEDDLRKFNDDLKAKGHKPLSSTAADRFRELSARPKPEDVEKIVAPLKQQAERMAQWDQVVQESGATGAEIQNALYVIQATKSGNPKAEMAAADAMFAVVQDIYKRNGRELPGAVDPLDGHNDLAAAVEAGEITRKFALETAKARAMEVRNNEQNQRQQEQQQFQQAETEARAQLNQLGQSLHTADPAQYVAKYSALIPAMKIIRETMHPSQWQAAVFRVYQELPYTPAPAPAPTPAPRPHVGAVPMRPTGGNGAMRAAVPKDEVAAFKFGVESVRS